MNTIWSKYIQGAKTLYYSRKLRFDDKFSNEYKELFGLDETKQLKILEIGCGSGALAGSLARWYPTAEIIAIDRDGEFIRFAKEHEKGVTFIEADIAALPFANESFDVVISNTVCEHIEHSVFYKEQLGGRYERQGDYLIPCITLPAEKEQPIGLFGRRHLDYLKQHRRVTYLNLLTSGRLNSYLADIDRQAQERLERLIEGMKQAQGITERLKAENALEWVGRMNNIRACAREIVNEEIVYMD